MNTRNESEHPRDEARKFTFKNGITQNTNKNKENTTFKLKAEINKVKPTKANKFLNLSLESIKI